VAPINRRRIYERDGYVCHICKRKTDPTKRVPHPMAPTIDHVIPLNAGVNAGGTHEPANAACAHFICNSRKGDRAMADQLALFG
jgi:5-methylcytosine-specific restriction endonuclease McrA